MKLVAVTSCPTGIAHSQMAAENLEQTAEKLGPEIRVEVQGAMNAEDELTAAEVQEADAVIIAADTLVNRDRFEGTTLVKGTVKDAVNDAEGLVNQAVECAARAATAPQRRPNRRRPRPTPRARAGTARRERNAGAATSRRGCSDASSGSSADLLDRLEFGPYDVLLDRLGLEKPVEPSLEGDSSIPPVAYR